MEYNSGIDSSIVKKVFFRSNYFLISMDTNCKYYFADYRYSNPAHRYEKTLCKQRSSDVFGPIAKKAGALTRHDGATTRRSHAGQRPMRRGIGRQDYSNKLKIARSRSGIPDHSCPPPSPSLPPFPLLDVHQPPPLSYPG